MIRSIPSVESDIRDYLAMHQEEIARGYTNAAELTAKVTHNYVIDRQIADIQAGITGGTMPEGAGRLEMQVLTAQRAETRVLADS